MKDMDSITVDSYEFFSYRAKLIALQGTRYLLQRNIKEDFGWAVRYDAYKHSYVYIDFFTPESKTFFLLDFGTDKVSKPKSLKERKK